MSTKNLSLTSTIPLPSSSLTQPRLGFGVYTSLGDTCTKSCLTALKAGYRHIDSAQFYENESQVGHAVQQSGIPRKDIYLTSKIVSWGATPSHEEAYEGVVESVRKIGGGKGDGEGEKAYADLFLIHNAGCGDETNKVLWGALEQGQEEGLVKSIGVSNAGVGHLERLKKGAKVWPPAVNQIELHPWNQQRKIVEYCHANGIVVQAYCPLVRNEKADDPTLNAIAKQHKKNTGQVLIRYCLQKGWVPLPKSDTPSRIEGNADVFDFELSEEDMKKLDDLDQGEKGAIVQAVSNE